MKKILLLLLIISSWNSFSQKTQAIQAVPPPPGFSVYEKIDSNNDGFVTFEMDFYLNYVRARALSQFGINLSEYTLQFFYNSNPIINASYTNSAINQQFLQLVLTYNGTGPEYNQITLNNLFSNHLLRTIPYNGDIDNDGILNYIEDLNANSILMDDNTDGDANQNFRDSDDDGDSILTINEDYNNNGSVLDDDMNGNGTVDYLDILARGTLTVNLKLFIEGYYAGSSMMRSVRYSQDGVSPLTDVENISVELHNSAAPYELVTSATALLKTNGTITCSFSTASVGSYYIVIQSSNGITIWSANPQTLSTTPLTYDFSTAANKAYGSNLKNLGSGVFGLYSGDINQDESIDASDATYLTNDIENSAFGIKLTDLNGDGSVDVSDLPMYENNQTLSIFCNRP